MNKSLRKNRTFPYLSTKYLLITKRKGITLRWKSLENRTLISTGTSWNYMPPDRTLREHRIPSVKFLPKMHNATNHHTIRNWGTLYEILAYRLQKFQGHESQGKTEELYQTEIKRWVNTMHNHGLDPFTIKGITGTLVNLNGGLRI